MYALYEVYNQYKLLYNFYQKYKSIRNSIFGIVILLTSGISFCSAYIKYFLSDNQ